MEGGIVFENGIQAKYDVVICADGVRSRMREQIGIIQQSTPSTSSCYSCLIQADKLRELGLKEFADSSAIQFWGGIGIEKIVMGASSNRDTICCYCFYAAEENSIRTEGWDQPVTGQCLAATFPDLDERVRYLFRNADDTKMWHLYNHNPYPYWVKGRCCLLGDAAHPMMPDQSQGACMAIEDAGALGILFSSEYDYLDITERLHLYELERKPRATRLQESSRRARTDITERIGWSSVTDKPGKLTIEEVCGYDMHNEIKRLVQQFRGAHKA
jgi:salicylate hydroxylase